MQCVYFRATRFKLLISFLPLIYLTLPRSEGDIVRAQETYLQLISEGAKDAQWFIL